MNEWLEPQPVEVPEALRQAVGGHPLVAEVLVRRGIADTAQAQAFLDPEYYRPASAGELPGVAEAVACLSQTIAKGERILVWGDFDVDGLASTAILLEGLTALGARVSHHIPSRGEGHGVHLDTLRGLLAADPPALVLTCDTGVGAAAAVAYARGLGVDFCITDHHALPAELPAARALVNPCLLPAEHPLRTLPGAGCAYLVASALAGGSCERSLDLLALAIVADVAPLQGDVRYYLQRGLKALRAGGREGLQALCEVAGVAREGLDEGHLGYALGPRLNALGRLAHGEAGVELFLTADATRARTIAAEMEGLNNQRQLLTSQVLQAAREQVERDPAIREAPLIIASHPSWPPGIVGLVAGRLAERYGKPALVLATPPEGLARGSARSVPGIDIAAAIAAASDLLVGHGGHPLAAGLSLKAERLPELRRRLVAEVARRAASAPPRAPLAIDSYLELTAVTPELARDLARLGPFGPGNPPVRLAARRLRVSAQAAVGRGGEHRKVYVQDSAGHEQRVFWWQAGDQPAPEGIFDLAYTIRPSNYLGRDEVTVEWLAVRSLEPAPAVLVAPVQRYTLYDHRDEPAPEATLRALLALGPILVYGEGEALDGVPLADRLAAAPAEALALWTAPPGPLELAALLERVQPQRVHLFARDPGVDEPAAFLRRLAGLVRYTRAHYAGVLDSALAGRMAAQTAQRTATVWVALRWLAARGHIALVERPHLAAEAAAYEIGAGPGTADEQAARELAEQLRQCLRETAAYRAYAQQADPHVLLAVGPAHRARQDPP